jgi:hypothetical protein
MWSEKEKNKKFLECPQEKVNNKNPNHSPGRSGVDSSVTAAAPKGGAQGRVVVREVEHGLREAGGLDDAADLHGTLLFDELADREEQSWGELFFPRREESMVSKGGKGEKRKKEGVSLSLTSEYHRYCHDINLIRLASMALAFPSRSCTDRIPFRAFGLNLMPKQASYASAASSR